MPPPPREPGVANSATPQPVAPLVCTRCGGGFQEGAAVCPWCQAGIALESRGRSAFCTQCARRAPVGALWCPGCGQRLGAQPLAPVSGKRGCPRCAATLRERKLGERALIECAGCGGLWLTVESIEELVEASERGAILAGGPMASARETAVEKVRYLPCPACGELMQRRNHGASSGVIVDSCRAHGVWLDAGELERIRAWARAGGPERERRRRVEQARREAEARPASGAGLPPELSLGPFGAGPLGPFAPGGRNGGRPGLIELLAHLLGLP